jgi:hypothetical protein
MLRRLAASALAVLALGAGAAVAAPPAADLFVPFLDVLQELRTAGTDRQRAAVERALREFKRSQTATVVGELRLLDRMVRTLDRGCGDAESYRTERDRLVWRYQAERVGPLAFQANVAVADDLATDPAGPASRVTSRIDRFVSRLDVSGDGVDGTIDDYRADRRCFRRAQKDLARYCEDVIARYGD